MENLQGCGNTWRLWFGRFARKHIHAHGSTIYQPSSSAPWRVINSSRSLPANWTPRSFWPAALREVFCCLLLFCGHHFIEPLTLSLRWKLEPCPEFTFIQWPLKPNHNESSGREGRLGEVRGSNFPLQTSFALCKTLCFLKKKLFYIALTQKVSTRSSVCLCVWLEQVSPS